MAGLKSNSKRVYTKGDRPSLLPPALPSLPWASSCPTPAGRLGSVSCGVTVPFLWVLVHARFCLWLPSLESLFFPVLWPFRAGSLGIPSPFVRSPGWGSLTRGSKPSQQWENFFGIIVFQFVGHPPSGYWIWFYRDCVPPTLLLQPLLCLWMWGTFFWWVQCPPVDGCSTASCSFGALAGGDEWTSDSDVTLKNQLSFLNLSINIISYFFTVYSLQKEHTTMIIFTFDHYWWGCTLFCPSAFFLYELSVSILCLLKGSSFSYWFLWSHKIRILTLCWLIYCRHFVLISHLLLLLAKTLLVFWHQAIF